MYWKIPFTIMLLQSMTEGLLFGQTTAEKRLANMDEILERAKQIHAYWESVGGSPDQDKRVRVSFSSSVGDAGKPQSCCSSLDALRFTGILAVAPTDPTGTVCTQCAPNFGVKSLGIPWPTGTVKRGSLYSTIMTFKNRRVGPCTVTFLWFRLSPKEVIQGSQIQIADCLQNAGEWLVEFQNVPVPDVPPGEAVAVGVVTLHLVGSDPTVNFDFQHFFIE